MKIFAAGRRLAEEADSRDRIRRDEHTMKRQILVLTMLSVVLTVVLELFSQRGFTQFIKYVSEAPFMLLLNCLLMFNVLFLAQLVHRRIATLCMLVLIWLVLGVTNYVVTSYRTQPFTLADVMLIKDMFSLITVYFSWLEIVGIFFGLAFVVVAIVFMYIKAPKRESVQFVKSAVAIITLSAMSFGCVNFLKSTGFIHKRFTTLKDAYSDYGFVYTFLATFADLGISKPADYSVETVDEIIGAIEPEDKSDLMMFVTPNIIYVQLESFFDTKTLSDNIKIWGDATPYFHKMLDTYPSGKLYVPVVGGGTANTEFEMLSGMNLDFFGPGELPYYTVLRDTPCETICYVLDRLGYTSTAVHNYMATFYGRDQVYSRLGFDTFESMEYMSDLEYGDVGWAKDEVLIDSVIDAMKSTKYRDFVMSITVSTHGKYPKDRLLPCAQNGIQVLESDDHLDPVALQNYLNLAKGMDEFIEKFMDAMKTFDEPVICVFYGDHLPALEWDSSSIDSGNLFETQYFIWTNYGREFDAPDIQAYRFTANLLKQLGIEDGTIFRYHQKTDLNDEGVGYLTELEILEYDMFYGELKAYDGVNPFEPTDIKLGIHDVEIDSVEYRYGRLLVTGDYFNEFSKIILDEKVLPTAYIDRHTVAAVIDDLPEEAESLYVAQLSRESIELSRTAPWSVADISR